MSQNLPWITVSIVSYNTRELLRACLRSLLARQEAGEATLEIVVADNGSTDGSVAMVQTEFPSVRCLSTGGNIGYGRANNLALSQAQGDFCFILNSDTEIEAGALTAMTGFLQAHPEAGAVGAQLILPDGTIQPSCARDPGLMSVLWEQIHFDKLFPRSPMTGHYAMTDWDYGSERQVDQVVGACLFVRRTVFEQVGGFDPAYFMYFEDTDFCIRLRRTGWSIWFLPQARLKHHLGASSQDWQSRARMIVSYNQSRYYFFSHRRAAWQGGLLKALVLLGAGLRLLTWSVLSLTRPGARVQRRIFRDVWRKTWAMKPEGVL